MPGRTVFLLLAVVLLAGAGAPATARSVALDPGPCVGGPAALADDPGLRFIPADAVFALSVRDPAALFETFGWSRMRAHLAEVSEESRTELGQDLLDPAGWAAIGIDVNGPAGFAWLDIDDETFAVWATVRDRAAIRAFLDEAARRNDGPPFVAETIGDALVLHPPDADEAAVILRGDRAILVVSDEGEAQGRAAVQRVATVPARESLAFSDRFIQTLDRLAFGRDAAAWIDFQGLVGYALGFGDRSRAVPSDPVQWELDEAINSGAPNEQIRYLREMRDGNRRWEEERREQAEKQRELVEKFLGGLGSVGIGFETRSDVLALRAVADIPEKSLFRRLVRPGDGVPTLVRALDSAPLYLSWARLDIDVFMELLELVLAVDGESLDELRADFQENLGLDLDRDVVAAFSGELGFAVTGVLPVGRDGFARPDGIAGLLANLGGTIMVGVRNPGKARVFLSRLLTKPPLGDMVRPSGDGAWRFDVPGWKAIHIAVTADQLVLTSDEGLPGRVRKSATGRWFGSLVAAPLKTLLSNDRASSVWAMDLAALAGLGMVGKREEMAEGGPAGYGPDSEAPYSDVWKGLQAEHEGLSRQIEALRSERERNTRDHGAGLMALLGTTAFVGHTVGDSYAVCGGQYFTADSLEAFVDAGVTHAGALIDAERRDHERWELESQRWQLEERLMDQRAQDIRAWEERRQRHSN